MYVVEVEPERYALNLITEKNKEAVVNNLRKVEGMLFVGYVDDLFIAFCRSKDRPALEIPGAHVTKVTPKKRMWGIFAEY